MAPMAFGQTTSSWEWALSELMQHALNNMRLHPYRVVGYPHVSTTHYPHKRATMEVTITFDIELDPLESK